MDGNLLIADAYHNDKGGQLTVDRVGDYVSLQWTSENGEYQYLNFTAAQAIELAASLSRIAPPTPQETPHE